MRFWAQVNFADLAPYAQAFGVAMPSAGLLQMFGGDEGGELARNVPAAEVERLELRRRIPINPYWATVDDAERLHRSVVPAGKRVRAKAAGLQDSHWQPDGSRHTTEDRGYRDPSLGVG